MPSTTRFSTRRPQRTQGFLPRIFPSASGGGLGRGRFPPLLALCALGLILLAAACGGSESGGVIVPPTEEFGGPEFAAVVISTDLAVGRERLAFGVVPRDGPPLSAERATVRTYFLPPNTDGREEKQTLTAEFLPWPTSAAGVFIARPEFDAAGLWELEAELTAPDGAPVSAQAAFEVKETSDTPAIGAPAPASVTPKASDVADLSRITTAGDPDPALYARSVHEAVAENKPFVVLFATPAYCVSFTCGPQVQELSGLRERYAGRANFIHVEVFQDPHLIEGGRPAGGLVDAVEEWGLPTEPWTFVVDANGIVRAKFEQYTPADAIEEALLAALN